MNIITGAMTALITPFKNGKLDSACFEALIKRQIAQGMDAVVPVGTTGESATLSHSEHKECIEIAVATCKGTGEVQASILVAEEIENNLDYLINRKEKEISLLVHPYLASFFTKGVFSIQMKWFLKYKKWISVRGLSSQHLLEYSYVDKKNNEITL